MKFSVAHPNPGKRSAENLTKISRQISRHLWQRNTEKNFTSALLQGSCSEVSKYSLVYSSYCPGLPSVLLGIFTTSSGCSMNDKRGFLEKGASDPPRAKFWLARDFGGKCGETLANLVWKRGKDPHPQDKIQHLDFTKDPRQLYYKTPPCVFYHKNVRSKAVFSP